MIRDIYVDAFRTKYGGKNISILGLGHIVCESEVKMNEIPKIIQQYNLDTVNKWGNDIELHYYVDIRGVGMGVYDLLTESEECKDLNIHKLNLGKSNYKRTGNHTLEVKFDKLINVNGDISSDEVIEKMTEIAKGVVNDLNTKIKNDLTKVGVI